MSLELGKGEIREWGKGRGDAVWRRCGIVLPPALRYSRGPQLRPKWVQNLVHLPENHP